MEVTEQETPEKGDESNLSPIEILSIPEKDDEQPIKRASESPSRKVIHNSPGTYQSSDTPSVLKERQIEKTTQKLIDKVLSTQKELENTKILPSPTLNIDSPLKQELVLGDVFEDREPSENNSNLSSTEKIRKSVTGHDEHIVPFNKNDIEEEAGADLKNLNDTMFEIRNTKQYEDEVEALNASKILSSDQIDKIATPFATKVQNMSRQRSNSINKSDRLQLQIRKKRSKQDRRHSINKKIKTAETSNLMENSYVLEGTVLSHVDCLSSQSSVVDKTESEINPKDTEETYQDVLPISPGSQNKADQNFNRNSDQIAIGVGDFTPKDDINGVQKLETFDEVNNN